MPTGEDYRRAADDFDALAESLNDEIAPLRSGLSDDVVQGGRLRTTLETAIDEISNGLGTSATGYAAVATECRTRAIACDRYLIELDAHLRSVAAWDAATEAERQTMTIAPAPHREPWMSGG